MITELSKTTNKNIDNRTVPLESKIPSPLCGGEFQISGGALKPVDDPIHVLVEKMRSMGGKKILHFGSLAGWPHTLTRVSRSHNVDSENVVHIYKDVADLDRKLSYDKSIFTGDDSLPVRILKTFRFFLDCPKNYCLIHYHSTTLMHREYHFLFEGQYFKKNNLPMVLSLGGSDARLVGDAKKRNSYFYKDQDYFRDLLIRLRWLSWSNCISVCATDPELAMIARNYFDDVEIFRQPVELERFPFSPPDIYRDVPVILHVPTDPHVKGTEYIVRAVENLKKKGLKFDFRMIRQLTQREFYQILSTCDIYVDELRCGSHGMTAVESMAMGKPTISYIRDDLINHYPHELPVVKANTDTIEDVLERLVCDAVLRREIGFSSRKYVEKYHCADVVFCELSKIYTRLLSYNA